MRRGAGRWPRPRPRARRPGRQLAGQRLPPAGAAAEGAGPFLCQEPSAQPRQQPGRVLAASGRGRRCAAWLDPQARLKRCTALHCTALRCGCSRCSRSPMVRSPVGSTSRASLSASEVARSALAGVTARIMALSPAGRPGSLAQQRPAGCRRVRRACSRGAPVRAACSGGRCAARPRAQGPARLAPAAAAGWLAAHP